MEIDIDYEECLGYANCVIEAPEIFDVDDANKVVLLRKPNGNEELEAVRAAARMCPVRAISLRG